MPEQPRTAFMIAAFTAIKLSSPPPAKDAPGQKVFRKHKPSLQPPGAEERWIAFEQGRKAHHMRADDLFPAERTLCGKTALDADLHRLPVFNSYPADYRLCRVCCVVLYRVRS